MGEGTLQLGSDAENATRHGRTHEHDGTNGSGERGNAFDRDARATVTSEPRIYRNRCNAQLYSTEYVVLVLPRTLPSILSWYHFCYARPMSSTELTGRELRPHFSQATGRYVSAR